MNSYGQPTGPDFAMLDELHRLWGRVFGQRQAEAQPQRGKALPVLVLIGAAIAVLRFVAF